MEERFNTFTVLIGSINRCIHRIKTVEMAEYNLKSSHMSCLYYLYKVGSMTAKRLCEVCDEDKANVSRAIKYLEHNGLLCSTLQVNRHNQCLLSLTEVGQRIGKEIAGKVDYLLELIGEGVSEEEREIMYRALDRINRNLQRICFACDGLNG